tara:strand:+ start:228 stop:1337 length:1110 start_codon:yes stop_codon:yes gene_type:complete
VKKVCAILFLGLLLGGDVLANHFSYKVPEIKVKEFDRWMGKLKRKDGKWYFKSPKKFKKLLIDKVDIPPDIKKILDKSSITSLLYYEKDKVIYDYTRTQWGVFKIKTKINDKTLFNGRSKSKSISSLIFGLAQCEGLVDPNKTYGDYLPEIKNSFYAKIKIKDSMNMMARDNKIREGNYMEKVPFPDSIVTFIKRRPKANEPHGDNKFYYSNPQPDLATAVVVKQLGGKSKFKKFVQKNLNEKAKLKYKTLVFGHKGYPGFANWFWATRYDWLRIGIFVSEEIQNKDSCLGNYLRDAISNSVDTGRDWGPKYGKFFYTETPYGLKSKSIMMRGHGYKLLVIDYENDKILEIHSIAADYKPQILIPLIMQ